MMTNQIWVEKPLQILCVSLLEGQSTAQRRWSLMITLFSQIIISSPDAEQSNDDGSCNSTQSLKRIKTSLTISDDEYQQLFPFKPVENGSLNQQSRSTWWQLSATRFSLDWWKKAQQFQGQLQDDKPMMPIHIASKNGVQLRVVLSFYSLVLIMMKTQMIRIIQPNYC